MVIATFHTNIVTHIQYIFNGFDDKSTKHKFQRKKYSDINGVIWRKKCKNVLLLLFANIITLYQLSQFLLKKSNHENSL